MRFGLPALPLATALCAIGSTAEAQGIPQDGFPSWQERTLWVLVNRDRADPETALVSCVNGCGDAVCYQGPRAPLAYSLELSHSARLQPTLLAMANVMLMHPSPCVLNPDIVTTFPDQCDGSPSCACQTPVQCSAPLDSATCACNEDTSDPTKFEAPSVRGALFAPDSQSFAENLAAGQVDPMDAEVGWVTEFCSCCGSNPCVNDADADRLTCPDGTEGGHRYNIMSMTPNSIGVGAALAPVGDCYSNPSGEAASYYWGQDFGYFANAQFPKLLAGSHYPQGGTSVTFYANWYDPDGRVPATTTVIVGNQSHAMSLDRGSGGNATYSYPGTLPQGGCQPYTFAFTEANGKKWVLPSAGEYLAGEGCRQDYQAAAASSGGGCASGSGTPWIGALFLALALRKPGGSPIRRRKLTKWQ